jgi:hypothetical protein
MTTQAQHATSDVGRDDERAPAKSGVRRARLTIDLDPELHMRLKMAAAANGVSMRELVECLLLQTLPAMPHRRRIPLEQRRPISQGALEQMERTREQVMRGRVFADDAADLLREAREERMEAL